METFARQTILPPPPSISRALAALVHACWARMSGLVRAAIDRLLLALKVPPTPQARASAAPSAPDWTTTEPKLAAMLAVLRDPDSGALPRHRSISETRPRHSAKTMADLRRAG